MNVNLFFSPRGLGCGLEVEVRIMSPLVGGMGVGANVA